MNLALRSVTLTVGLALVCEATGCGSEPLDVAPNVDLERFQGKWYEVARLPRTTQTDCHGTTGFYSMGGDGSLQLVNQCNVGAPDGPLHTVAMTATLPDKAVPAKLALDVGGYAGDYWILEVGSKYEYAVVGHPSRLYFWILSRTPALDTATTQGIVQRAQNNHFDTAQLQYTPQPPSGERASAQGPVGPVPPALSTGCSMAAAPRRLAGAPGGAWVLGLLAIALSIARRLRSVCSGSSP